MRRLWVRKKIPQRRLLACRIGLHRGTAAEASRGRGIRQKLGGRPKITGRRRTLVQTLASSASAAGCRGMLRGYPKKTVDTGGGNVCGAPWTAAACCSSRESGSRLHAVHGLRLKPDSNPRDLLPSVPLCSLCFLLFQISPLRMRRTKTDFYRRSLRTQSSHGLSEADQQIGKRLTPNLSFFASFASFCSKSLLSGCGEPRQIFTEGR